MKIKITKGFDDMKFPYGLFPGNHDANRKFIIDNVGNIFDGDQFNMNYYVLANGMYVHVYNAFEVKTN